MAFDGTNLIFATNDELRLHVGVTSQTYKAWPITFTTDVGGGQHASVRGMFHDGTYLWVIDHARNLFQIDLSKWLSTAHVRIETFISLNLDGSLNPYDITYDGVDLFVLDKLGQAIRRYDGISNIFIDKINLVGELGYYYIASIEWVAGELILVNTVGSDTTIILDGFSSTIKSTFTNTTAVSGMSFVGTNLMSVNKYNGTVYTHQGISKYVWPPWS